MTMVIVGAGPTGVELAGQIREMAVRSLKGDFRRIDPTKVRVVLVDGGAEPLATFGDELSVKAARSLERMGVELMMGARVTAVDGTGVDVAVKADSARLVRDGQFGAHRVPHRHLGGGGAGVAAGDDAGRSHRRRARPGRPHLGAPRPHPPRPPRGVRGGGHDVAEPPARRGRGGHAGRPPLGQLHPAPAPRRGRHETLPFRYRDLGSLATIGRFRAVDEPRQAQAQRVPGVGGLVLRPPGVPDQLREPVHDRSCDGPAP